MPFNLGSAVYNFQVSGLSTGVRQHNAFHGNLQLLQRGNHLGPLQGGFSRLNGLIGTAISRLGVAAAAAGAFSAIGGGLGIGGAIKLAAEMEQIEKSMEVFLGDAGKARSLVNDLKQFGAETPLDFPGVLKASQSLLAGNVAAKDLVKTLRMIGDVAFPLRGAAGVEHLAQVYATFKSQGQITKQDVNQFAFMGIPIWEALANVTGKTTAQVRDLVSKGKIGFPEMHNALESLTKEGGRFHNMMAESSKTLLGRWSTFIDIFRTDVIAKLGERIIHVFRLPQLLEQAISFAQTFADKFGPQIDTYLIKLRQLFIDSIPIVRVAAMTGMEYLKVGIIIGRTLLPIVQGIGAWMDRNMGLVRTLTQVVIWSYALNTAVRLGTTIFGYIGAAAIAGTAKITMYTGAINRLTAAMAAHNATAAIMPAAIAKWSSATALPLAGYKAGGGLMAGAMGMGRTALSVGGRVAPVAGAGIGLAALALSPMIGMAGQLHKSKVDNQTLTQAGKIAEAFNKYTPPKFLADKKPPSAPSGPITPTPLSPMGAAMAALGGAKGMGGPTNMMGKDAAFVGISDLAEKMQLNALNSAHDKLMEDLAGKTAASTEALASAVDGSRLRVKLEDIASVPTTYGRP